MTTWFHQDVKCSHCGRKSQHKVLGSTNAFGSPDLDLRPPEMQRSTMEGWLQLCPHCGYCAGDLSEVDGDLSAIDSPEYHAVLHDERFPELARHFLARALLLIGSEHASAARSRLCAAWVCDDAGEDNLAIACREGAAACWERLKPFEDDEQGLSWGAVFVDTLRRARQFGRAASECDSFLALDGSTGIVRQVLEFQRRLIDAEDSGSHRIAECAE